MSDSSNSRSSREGRSDRGEFQASVDRLEKAVQDLVGNATSEFSDRASSLIDEITTKLEREFDPKRRSASRAERARRRAARARSRMGINASADDDFYGVDDEDDLYDLGGADDDLYDPSGAAERMRARRRARRQSTRRRTRSARLYRDPAHAKIGGVCAGIARYYGMETWVVRCIAVTGLLFLPSIVFPAYWIAYFVMDTPPREEPRPANRRGAGLSEMPELGRVVSARENLRNVEAELNQVELRLRRMESHVTSGQYELQRELNRIDVEPTGTGADSRGGGGGAV